MNPLALNPSDQAPDPSRTSPNSAEPRRLPSAGGPEPLLETRNEGLMKQAARLLAAAGGYRHRHYLIKVEAGRAVSLEESDPPRVKRTLL